MNKIVTPQEMSAFVIKFGKGAFPNQRFGQAFCNEFNHTDPDLFYQTDRKVAEEYIWTFLVL